MKTVYTTGVFDVLHPGHIATLKKASRYGDRLVVGVQEDESVFLQKGKYPAMSTQERMKILSALPFVWKSISYSDIDQRPILKVVKPDVMVQTNEWKEQTDRSDIVSYLKKNNIDLVIIPIKKNISSSIIKNRIIEREYSFRNDMAEIRKKLDIKGISSLCVYEKFDSKRVTKLIQKIKKENTFTDPITVAKYKSSFIVIDGVNRLEAMKRLGVNHVLVQYVDYMNIEEVQLRNNVHFLDANINDLQKCFDKKNIIYESVSKIEAMRRMSEGKACALCVSNKSYIVFPNANGNGVNELNCLVDSYINTYEVYRLSELSQETRLFPTQVIFKKFSVSEIAKLAEKKDFLQSGITWHRTKNNVIRFSVPLKYLKRDISDGRAWISKEISRKVEQRDIRYHPAGVYICDEWE